VAQKKLEPSSDFEKYDLDADGVVSDAEIARAEKIQETEDKSRKHLAQLRLARYSLMGMGVYTLLLFMPFIPDSRIMLLKEISPLLYISLSGVVGAYMGFTSWMDRK
tara:strand:- start:26054 stop:26374 length:321 start_codon:yes stop_codon:yes gene_type:complete